MEFVFVMQFFKITLFDTDIQDLGNTIGTQTKVCEKDTDYCYNATADLASFSTIQKAGCNSMICKLYGAKCFNQELGGSD